MRHRDLVTFVDQCPPFLIVALARKPGTRRRRGMTVTQISKSSGISGRTLQRLFAKESWAGMKLETVAKIMQVCGINIFRMGNARAYIKDAAMADIPFRSLPPTARQELLERMARWAKRGN